MMILRTFADEDEWHAWRRAGIGASSVAAAATGKYGSGYGVVAERLGLITTEVTMQMLRGHDWEDRLSDAVSALTGWVVVAEQCGAEHSDNPVWRCTPDGLLAPHDHATVDDIVAGLELKTYGAEVRPTWDYYRMQCQFQALVLGVRYIVLAVAKIDDVSDACLKLELEVVEADPFLQWQLASLADELWGHVLAGTLPLIDDPSALDVAKELNAELDPTAKPVDLSDLAADVARFRLLKDRISTATDEAKVLEGRIREAVGPAPGGTCPGYKVSVSKPKKILTDEAEAELMARHPEHVVESLDRAACKKAHKAEYEALTSARGGRTVTVSAVL